MLLGESAWQTQKSWRGLEGAGRSPQSPYPESALTLCDETGHSGQPAGVSVTEK